LRESIVKKDNELIAAFPNIDATEMELSELHHGNATYSPQLKVQVVVGYLTTGSLKEAADMAEIPYETAREWKYHSAWWDKGVAIARKSLQKDLDDTYTRMLHKSTTELMDRVEKGNKKGNNRVPLSARELLDINVKIFEKRALLRGEPTTRSEKTDVQVTVHALAKELEEFSRKQSAATQPPELPSPVDAQFAEVPIHPKYEHDIPEPVKPVLPPVDTSMDDARQKAVDLANAGLGQAVKVTTKRHG
jgi:hypothetical protein